MIAKKIRSFYSLLILLYFSFSGQVFSQDSSIHTLKLLHIFQVGYYAIRNCPYYGPNNQNPYLGGDKISRAFEDTLIKLNIIENPNMETSDKFEGDIDLINYAQNNAHDPESSSFRPDVNSIILCGIEDVQESYLHNKSRTGKTFPKFFISDSSPYNLPGISFVFGRRINESFTDERRRVIEYTLVTLHELGHAIGIRGQDDYLDCMERLDPPHSSKDSAGCVMNPSCLPTVNGEKPYYCHAHKAYIYTHTKK